MRKIDLSIAVWFVVSMIFWVGYCLVARKYIPFVPYFAVVVGIIGTLVSRHRANIERWTGNWGINRSVKFLLLGYGAVLVEEVFAAIANGLDKDIPVYLYLVRIGQFWALNIFTFSGLIIGFSLLIKYFEFSKREVFYLSGLWGLYAEKTIFSLAENPAFFLFAAAPNILTYGLIISPALLSYNIPDGRRRLPRPVRYVLAYVVIFALSMPAILLLQTLRQAAPSLFPPADWISL